MLAQTGHSHELNCRNGLALLWQISSGTEFPIQFFNDSWVVGPGTADWPRIHSGSEASLDCPLRCGAKRNDTCCTNTICRRPNGQMKTN